MEIQQPQNVKSLSMIPLPFSLPPSVSFPVPPPQDGRKGNSSSQLVKIMLLITPDLL